MGSTIQVGLVDGQGRTTSTSIELVNTITTIAAAQTAYDAWFADFIITSGLGVQNATVTIPLVTTVQSAQSSSNMDEGARMKLLMQDGGFFSYRIPGPIKDISGNFVYIVGGEVDPGHAAITGYFANWLTAGAFRFTKYGQRVLAVNGITSGVLEKK